MRSPVLDLIAANHTTAKAPADTSKRANGGDCFSLFLKESTAATESRSQTPTQSLEARSTEKHERGPTADRWKSDSKHLDEARKPRPHSEQPVSEQPVSKQPESESKLTAASEPPAATNGDQVESAQPIDDLEASLGEPSDATATVVNPTLKAVLATIGSTTSAPAAGAGTANVAVVSETAVAQLDRLVQASQAAGPKNRAPQTATAQDEPTPIPAAGHSDVKPPAKSPVAVAVANQVPVSKPVAAPIVEAAPPAPLGSGQPMAIAPKTAPKVASDVAAATPMASAPAVQATTGQTKSVNAEAPRPVVRSQAKLDTASAQAGDDDPIATIQTSRAVTAPATSSGIEQTAAAGKGTSDSSGSAGGKPFSADMPAAVGHSPATGAAFVQAFDRAEPHANANNGVAIGRMEPSEQIAIQVQRALGTGRDRVSIQLHPAELGRIEVKLDMSADNTMRVAVSVDKPETLDLLQRDARSLDRALQDAGIKTDSGSLSFDLRQQADNRQLGRHHQAYAPANDRPSNESVPSEAAQAASQRQAWHAGSVDLNV